MEADETTWNALYIHMTLISALLQMSKDPFDGSVPEAEEYTLQLRVVSEMLEKLLGKFIDDRTGMEKGISMLTTMHSTRTTRSPLMLFSVPVLCWRSKLTTVCMPPLLKPVS